VTHCCSSSIGIFSPNFGAAAKCLVLLPAIFAKQKARSVEPKTGRGLTNTDKGAKYGIPDSSCRRINNGALRGNHRWLPETARMVTVQSHVGGEARPAHDEIAALLKIIPSSATFTNGITKLAFLDASRRDDPAPTAPETNRVFHVLTAAIDFVKTRNQKQICLRP
jgi:hypothetical protein